MSRADYDRIFRVTQHLKIGIPDGTPRTRLEDFLFEHFPGLSRMYLREVVRDSKCEVNGRHENIGFRVRGGDFVEIDLDPSRETAMRAEDIPLDVVYEDAHLIVVNKPAGMLVHPTHRDKSRTLLNALVFYLNGPIADRGLRIADIVTAASVNSSISSAAKSKSAIRNPRSAIEDFSCIRPGLVHRLDKQTSGLIVVAKSTRVHRIVARQFQRKLVEKKYLALVDGVIKNDDGIIEGPIGRYAEEKRWDLKADGKHAQSRYRVLERKDDTTLLELEPVTGRTNQLRIHCASIGHPIVGDMSRGGSKFERLCLHAWKLQFRHPVTSTSVKLERAVSFSSE